MSSKPAVLQSLLLIASLTVASAAQTVSASAAQSTTRTPTVTAVLDGPRTPVFTTPQDACSPNDIPDVMARAFRDYTGTVHFMSASSTLFQSLGPDIDHLTHSCEVAHYSKGDPNPAAYNDQTWPSSFYTLDGKTIAALTHTEYHGWSHPGECHDKNIFVCEYDSDTYHVSRDGGYHYNSLPAPKNVVATLPFKYVIDHGPMGYSVDTNMIEWNGWFYAVLTDDGNWPTNCSGSLTGPNHCLEWNGGAPIRTQNVFDPASWRGWSGTDFTVSFVDPYLGPVPHAEEHVYTPVPYMTFVNGIYIYQVSSDPLVNVVVAALWNGYTTEYGPRGFYLTTSTDLVNWTKPKLVVKLNDLLKEDPKGSWQYAYFSLIDPNAPDMNFSMIGNEPYLYYVRLDNNGQDRVLFRQKLSLSANQ